MLSIPQVRAARALLDWSQEELGKRVGYTKQYINNIEKGRVDDPIGPLAKIQQVFESSGLIFSEGDGVKKAGVNSYILDSYLELLEDIERDFGSEGGEVLKHCVDDKRSSEEVINKVNRMKDKGISERLTVSEDNTYISGAPKDYRTVPADYFANSEVVLIYGNKISFFVEGKCLVIQSAALAQVNKHQFEYWWQKGGKVNG